MRRLPFLFFLLAAPAAFAQWPPPGSGTCAPGEAWAALDPNGVSVPVGVDGTLGWQSGRDSWPPWYEVPRGSGLSSMFTTTPWIGGYVGDELRISAARYDSYEFWPGPLAADGTAPADCSPYDRVWSVSRADLAAYDATGVATADLREWPWALGAPVVDGDGDPGNYDLEGGDRPAVSGDETLWWVMNDAGNTHDETGSAPMGLEVQAEAFAVAAPPSTPVGAALHYATLYRYRMTYRGTEPLEDAYIALHFQAHLGSHWDDYRGTDTDLGLTYTYNSDNDDDGFDGEGYGPAPPAIGMLYLEIPSTTDPVPPGLLSGHTRYYNNNTPNGDPTNAIEYRYYSTCRWKEGDPLTYGGDGLGGTQPTCYIYPGEPGTYWSEGCLNPACTVSNQPGSGRGLVTATGPFTLEPGQTETVTFAIVWARGTSNLDSVERLRAAARVVRAAYLGGRYDPQGPVPPPAPAPPPARFALGVAPSPFTVSTTVRYEVPEGAGAFRVAVYDGLGRRVAVLADGVQTPGAYTATLNGATLAPGVYVVRLETATSAASRVVIRTR